MPPSVSDLRSTISGSAGDWHGAIARDRQIMWRCPHRHVAREPGSTRFEVSARACGEQMLELVNDETGIYREMIRTVAARGGGSAGDQLMLHLIAELEPEADRLRGAL